MGNVVNLVTRKVIYSLTNCGGCLKEITPGEEVTRLVLPYTDHDEHVVLCSNCKRTAKRENVL